MRSRHQLGKFLSDQRPNQLRRTHPALCLLCQLERKSQQLRTCKPRSHRSYHDAENGYGGFASFIFNPDAKNQFRLVGSLRQDYYQIPIDPNPGSDPEIQIFPSYGLRDGEREPDGYVIFSWVHTFNPNTLLTVSPFYHYNARNYTGGADDFPVISNVNQTRQLRRTQANLNTSFLEKRS